MNKYIESFYKLVKFKPEDAINLQVKKDVETILEAFEKAEKYDEKETVKTSITKRHSWKKDEAGKIDEYAYSYDYHNGPVCEVCGESFCIHCSNSKGIDMLNEEECIPHTVCECGEVVLSLANYCPNCGRRVKDKV